MSKVKLGKYVDIKTGKLDANASSPDGEYLFFTCSKEPLRISSYSYDCECVLIAGNGDLNVKYYNGKFDAYQRTYIVESRNKDLLNTKYLYYFIDNNMERLRNQSIGGIIKYIKLANLTELSLPLPPIATQRQIAATLDKASELIALRKKQLDELDALAESVFYQLFGDPVKNEKGWEIRYLSELGSFKNGLNYKENKDGNPLKIFGIADFQQNKEITEMKSLNIIHIIPKISDEYYLKNNDILFVRSNGSKELVGRNLIVYPNEDKVSFSGFCIRFRLDSDFMLAKFVNEVLFNPSAKNKLLNKGRGCNINNVNQTMLSDLEIICPPLSLQNHFASIIEKIEAQKELAKQALRESEDLFQRLMQDMFKTK